MAASLALVSFVVIIVETRRDHEKINWETEQGSKARTIANRQIPAAILLLWQNCPILKRDLIDSRSVLCGSGLN